MVTKTMIALLCAAMAVPTVGAIAFDTSDQAKEVGASLHQKSSVALADIPPAVLAAVKAKRPEMTVAEAEYEVKNGNEYYDVEGIDAQGNEIELDLVLKDGAWLVVEIQRDLAWAAVPESVQSALKKGAPGVVPDRIIESDQDNGTIVYEFFTQSESGKEAKYEVALTGGNARFLKEEWAH